MAAGGTGSSSAGRRGRRRGHAALTEINVTPLVDVMLVLLIIFMVSAPLLTVAVPVELPKTDAAAVNEQTTPLTVTIRRDGSIYLQDDHVALADLTPKLVAMTGPGAKRPVFVRADGAATYAAVAQVMAKLSTNGFSNINLVTDATAEPEKSMPRRP